MRRALILFVIVGTLWRLDGLASDSLPALAEVLALADARRFEAASFDRLARHSDPDVRAAVARALGESTAREGAPLLALLARDSEPAVRAAAAQGSGRLASFLSPREPEQHSLVKELQRLLEDRDAKARSAAAWGVGMATPQGGELWLLHRLPRETDPEVVAAIVQELWRFAGPLWIKRVTPLAVHKDRTVRLAAAWALGRAENAARGIGLVRACRDADPEIRIVAVNGMRRSGTTAFWTELVHAASDPDPRVRVAAYESLVVALEKEPRRALAPGLADRLANAIASKDPTRAPERVAALRLAGVANCCAEQVKTALSEGGPGIRGEALVALARQHVSGADALVKEALASKELDRRLAAVRSLAWLPGALESLTGLLTEAKDPALQLVAVETIGGLRIGESGAVERALRLAVGCEDAAVRAAALEALASHKAGFSPAEILALLKREQGAALPDAAVSLLDGLAAVPAPSEDVLAAVDALRRGSNPVIARAAWRALRRLGREVAWPSVATGRDPEFYRAVIAWASTPRWLEVTTARGTMQVVLDTKGAPLTCYRFAELAGKEFFNGLTFHRVVANFVVQGGDPHGDGWGGPNFVLRDELTLALYERGAVGVALSGPDTGGSQLFVTLTSQPHLIGRYAQLGRVVAGLDVADRLRVGDKIIRVKAGEGALGHYYPVWYGTLDEGKLEAEIAGWKTEREGAKPQKKLIDLLATAKLRYGLVVAMGTWCGDSREQVPRLQAVLAALGAHSPFDAPHLIGVDRSKWIDSEAYPFGVLELVPTIVVTAGTSEIGRIVETPTSGTIEEDLVRILAPIEGWELPPHE